LLADLEETEAVFSAARHNPKGLLRIDMPSGIGRLLVIPALPQFTRRYPLIELDIGLNDRPVDLIREGVDCVLRGGSALDDSLVARPLVMLDQVTCASPDYVQRHGAPRTLAELEGHQMVEYFSSTTGKRFGLEFMVDDQVQVIDLPRHVSVNSSDGYLAACEAGYGLVQAPYYHVARQLKEGRLCEVLEAVPPPGMPLTALYPPHRQLSRRVRVFVDWLIELCAQPGNDFHRKASGS
jgi:DNA-binding transcriptional LysR family regulator